MTSDSLARPVRVEVITYVPTQYNHCKHCEVTWQVMGLRQKVQRDLMDSALPEDLQAEFHQLSEWAHTLPGKFADRVYVRLIDAASIEGFFKSLFRRFWRYPAFAVEGQRYVGSDFSQVDGLISRVLRRKEAGPRFPSSTTSVSN